MRCAFKSRWLSIFGEVTFGYLFLSSYASAVTVVVTSTADILTTCAESGVGAVGTEGCTLRDAITFSNANPTTPPAQNLIQFNIPGSDVQTIGLASPLPAITTGTVIDGYSQPGSSPNSLAVGDDAVLLISLQVVLGDSWPSGVYVLDVNGGSGSVIKGLVVNGAMGGSISVLAMTLETCCNQVLGNFIGVDPTGEIPGLGSLSITSPHNRIGGSSPADRNVLLSDLRIGIPFHELNARENVVEGNYIGTNAAGNAGLGGSLQITGGVSNTIARNVISGGEGVTVRPFEALANSNFFYGNFIGTDATGTLPVPNLVGMNISSELNIVGTPPGPPILGALYPGNRIAFNNGPGVEVIEDPVLGAVANRIGSNSIFSNGGLGIDLGGDGVTPNDNCDADGAGPIEFGANRLQNFPDLTGATVLKFKTAINGTLNSSPNTTFEIQLFSNQACDPSGFGQGETLIADFSVTTDGSCNAVFSVTVPIADAEVGRFITATATDPDGNTSEFSACVQVVPLHRLTRTRILIEGPVRVPPGVPVEFPIRVEAIPPENAGLPGPSSGEVVISDDAGDVCRAVISGSGQGACSLSFSRPGQYLVRAQYVGSQDFDGSTSPPQAVLVGNQGSGG